MTSRLQENKDLKEEIKKKKDIIDKLTADLENLAVRLISKLIATNVTSKEKNQKGLENHTRRMQKNDDKLAKEVESHADSVKVFMNHMLKLTKNSNHSRWSNVFQMQSKQSEIF